MVSCIPESEEESGDTWLALPGAHCVPGIELSLLYTVLFNISPTPTRPEAAEHRPPHQTGSSWTQGPAPPPPTRPEAPEHKATTRPETAEPRDTSWTIYCLCPERNLVCDRCPIRIWRSELYSLSTCPIRPGSRSERCDWVSSDSVEPVPIFPGRRRCHGAGEQGASRSSSAGRKKGSWCQHLGYNGLEPLASNLGHVETSGSSGVRRRPWVPGRVWLRGKLPGELLSLTCLKMNQKMFLTLRG